MIPRIRIANLPTPLEALPNLSTYLGGPRIFIKRDDLTGLALGGNKIRKLEFLLAEAQANGAKTLITTGAMQSNHCRQTAAVAARFGLACILVLVGDQPEQASGNYLLDKLLGAEVVWCNRAERDQKLKDVFNQAWSDGRRPYLIPYGGSSPVGAVAYSLAIQEVLDQGIQPDWIIFPTSSGGTQAGMTLGARKNGYKGKLLGISVDEPAQTIAAHAAELATEAADRLSLKESFAACDVLVNEDYVGGGYGVFSALEKDAIRVFAGKEAVLLDPVYTGRAAGGMIDLIRKGFFKREEIILFWHTGGTPALFADQYMDQLL
jgi:D-cysteine desulfhydrase family pyridoxal phosphate-dependent enzyme